MLRFSLAVVALLMLVACDSGDKQAKGNNIPPPNSPTADCRVAGPAQAVICGTALGNDGITALTGAEIRSAGLKLANLTSQGIDNPDQCQSDSRGDFACLLPQDVSGLVDFSIVLKGFTEKAFQANAQPGEVADAGNVSMVADNSLKWVVVTGIFDGVQVLLSQLKGCQLNDADGNPFDPALSAERSRSSADCENKGLLVVDSLDGDAFLASGTLNNFDALFVNCPTDLSSPENDAIIQAFVNTGKQVYFSDQSSSWVQQIYPGEISFLGQDTNAAANAIAATVSNPQIATALGNSVDVLFDLPSWSAIGSVQPHVNVFLQADITSLSPFAEYAGVHPVTVGWKQGGGCVMYTSYHIEGNSVGSDQELVMKYILQNIESLCI